MLFSHLSILVLLPHIRSLIFRFHIYTYIILFAFANFPDASVIPVGVPAREFTRGGSGPRGTGSVYPSAPLEKNVAPPGTRKARASASHLGAGGTREAEISSRRVRLLRPRRFYSRMDSLQIFPWLCNILALTVLFLEETNQRPMPSNRHFSKLHEIYGSLVFFFKNIVTNRSNIDRKRNN